MERSIEKKIFLALFLTVTIITVLATQTPNNSQDTTPKDKSYVEECTPYFVNALECPLDKSQSVQNLLNNQTVAANG